MTDFTGQLVDFPANGRGASGYLALPPEGGPFEGRGPGVLVLQEWWGLVDHIADRGECLMSFA